EELARVKELKEKVNNCQKENEELKERNQLVKVFDGRDNVKDVSRGQIGSGKRADFLQEVLTDTEPKKVVERDMQTHGAEFGFIVATCASGKIIKLVETIDPRKKIYVSDGDSNLFLVVKVVRELLINRYNFLKIDNETDKEQKLKKVED
ncbi:4391_t:CDS:2, partial [Funneliformis geosporum]